MSPSSALSAAPAALSDLGHGTDQAVETCGGDEAELLARGAAGDRVAWRELYERHREFVFRAAWRFMGNEADARDVVQDVFVALFSRARAYKPDGKFTSYLWRVVANRCVNERSRASNRRLDGEQAAAALKVVEEAPERSPERQLESKQRQERVRRAILALPERQRMAVVLSRFEGLSYEEIAQALECSVSSVESLLFRARQSLARLLADDSSTA